MLVVKSFFCDGQSEHINSGFGWTMIEMSGSYTLEIGYARLLLEDTETGEVTKFETPHFTALIEFASKYSPYGFAVVESKHYAERRIAYFVEIDKLSLEFLDYVDSVERVVVIGGTNKQLDAIMCNPDFFYDSIDNQNSLFTSMGRGWLGLCTLFRAVHCFKVGFLGDNFYLPCAGDCYSSSKFSYKVYRVNFSDVQAAKRFLSKAFMMYNNPIFEEIRS